MKTQGATIRWMAAVALGGMLGACGPRLVVRHDDPTVGELELTVDGGAPRELRLGQRYRTKLRQGWHEVDVRAPGARVNPYTEDGGPWLLWQDRGLELTISPAPTRR